MLNCEARNGSRFGLPEAPLANWKRAAPPGPSAPRVKLNELPRPSCIRFCGATTRAAPKRNFCASVISNTKLKEGSTSVYLRLCVIGWLFEFTPFHDAVPANVG